MQEKCNSTTKSGILFENFRKKVNGQLIELFVLSNINGCEVAITNFGARLISLALPDNNKKFVDVVLGHRTIEEYLHPENEFYLGATIGRYANRIGDGRFTLNDKKYVVEQNNGNNHLHGGSKGFHNVIWNANQVANNEITLSYFSKHLEEGYPGNLNVELTYKLNDLNELEIMYHATTDQTTIVNLTHHSYFNLAGEGESILDNHLLYINSDYITPINKDLIPTGELSVVHDTPFDFRQSKTIGRDLEQENMQLKYGGGYDHSFVLNSKPVNDEGLVLAARVQELKSKRIMELYTNKPGVQLYTGNFLGGNSIGKNGAKHKKRSGFCLETQYFPDSPNQPSFPSVVLKEGETYQSKSVYKFL